MKKRLRFSLLSACLLTALILASVSAAMPGVSRADDLSHSIEKAGHSIAHSVKHGYKKTKKYLKSKKFHQDMHRFAKDTGKAVKNAGNWLGKKIDAMKKKEANSQ